MQAHPSFISFTSIAKTIGIDQRVPQLAGSVDTLGDSTQGVASFGHSLAATVVVEAPPRQTLDLRRVAGLLEEYAPLAFAQFGDLLPIGLHQAAVGHAGHV
jgi:hypothetical protein